ncbi:MAG TPA: bifunctional diaminohydroxyphosphoribosylaminopyrimidine deaminase/5-amino-6-(5-phosphoribosylamino)uracil reductase RibD [Dehalococcoidia bacterium]
MAAPSTFMARALELAREALGTTSPNPAVGCVIVKGGSVIAEGYTQPPGGPHAEVVALRSAGDRARGATLYCTLEPCSHYGRTPPCASAIIEAGIARVVYSLRDPDPRVDGKGAEMLRAAGIDVAEGDGAEESAKALEGFIKHRTTGRPFVVVKYAASLDGKIAASSGDSRWVSGPQTLAWAHQMRTKIDAIMVGVSTVLIDNPQLTARPGGAEAQPHPLRVVVDSRGHTPESAAVLRGPARTLVATTAAATAPWRAAMRTEGAEVFEGPTGEDGRVSLPALLDELGRRGILALLVEGGGVLHGSFFDQHLVDKVHAVIAPMIVGASAAPDAVAGRGAAYMRDAIRLRDLAVERLGEDVLVTGYPVYPGGITAFEDRPEGER